MSDPNVPFHAGLRALGAARVLSWVLVAAYVAVGLAGVIVLAESDNEFSTDLYGAGEILLGLGFLSWLAVGLAMWAALAVWCSKTGAAARASGNARGSSSHMAWWGIFVPVGMLFVPFLAYKDAAKYVRAVSRYGQIRNGGEGWKSTPTPGLITGWWLMHLVAFICISGYGSVEETDEVAEGIFLTLAGMAGVAAATLGAVAFGSLIAETRSSQQSHPTTGMPHPY